MTYQEKIDNMVEHLKGFGSFQQMARFVLSLQDDDCPRCGGEGFVYSTHYADPYPRPADANAKASVTLTRSTNNRTTNDQAQQATHRRHLRWSACSTQDMVYRFGVLTPLVYPRASTSPNTSHFQ